MHPILATLYPVLRAANEEVRAHQLLTAIKIVAPGTSDMQGRAFISRWVKQHHLDNVRHGFYALHGRAAEPAPPKREKLGSTHAYSPAEIKKITVAPAQPAPVYNEPVVLDDEWQRSVMEQQAERNARRQSHGLPPDFAFTPWLAPKETPNG